jgi:hypothetical protein
VVTQDDNERWESWDRSSDPTLEDEFDWEEGEDKDERPGQFVGASTTRNPIPRSEWVGMSFHREAERYAAKTVPKLPPLNTLSVPVGGPCGSTMLPPGNGSL